MRKALTLLTLALLLACLTEPVPAQVPVDTIGWRYTDSVPTAWRYTDSVPVLDTLTPPPPPPDTTTPPPAGSHEPRGGTVVADNDWTGFTTTYPPVGKVLANWYRYAVGTSGRWVSDPAAPLDPDVLEVHFSGKQGQGPEHLAVTLPKGSRQVYIRAPLYVPPGYFGSSSGVQKLFHVWAPTDKGSPGSLAVPAIFGDSLKPLRSQIRIQGTTVTPTQATSFNIGGKPWDRGRWYVTEWLLVMNSPGQANGEAYLWQDGVLAATRRGITYSRAGLPWTVVQLNPTYGGTGTVPAGTRLRYGQIRVVGAP